MVLHVRTASVTSELLELTRARLRDLDPDVAVTVQAMSAHSTVAEALGHVLRRVLVTSALFGLLIATVGVLGTVDVGEGDASSSPQPATNRAHASVTVSQRTHTSSNGAIDVSRGRGVR